MISSYLPSFGGQVHLCQLPHIYSNVKSGLGVFLNSEFEFQSSSEERCFYSSQDSRIFSILGRERTDQQSRQLQAASQLFIPSLSPSSVERSLLKAVQRFIWCFVTGHLWQNMMAESVVCFQGLPELWHKSWWLPLLCWKLSFKAKEEA